MFNEIKINPFYNTYRNNISEEFYNVVLKETTIYNRVSAYFSSKALASYSNGIYEMYKKNGKINFIISKEIDENDYNQIINGYKNRELIEKELLEDFEKEELTISEKIKLSNVAYLIEQNIMDIKIAFVKKGIFHDKYGLMYDQNKNCIYFRGSNNETIAAISENFESFEVSCNWNNDGFENTKIKNAEEMFNRLWNNEENGIEVIEIPEVVKKHLMTFKKAHLVEDEEEEILANILYISLDCNNNLILINDLKEDEISSRDTYFQIYLNRYLKINENRDITVQNVHNYMDIKKVLNRLQEYSEKNNFNIYISRRLRKYIEVKDMKIEKREKLGIDIKNKEEYLDESYLEFKKIVQKEMTRQLREPQMWNAFHMVKMWKSANFSVPGAGKTTIVYGAYAYLSSPEINKVDKIIMIGPKNSFYAWKDEYVNNFGDKRQLKVLDTQNEIYTNSKQKIFDLRNNSGNKNLILINYESLQALKSVLAEILNDRVLLVFDEIHKIKGIETVRAGIALSLAHKVKYKIALTGTPIPNGYQDIYNTLKILYPEEYDTIFGFKTNKLKNVNEIDAKEINKKIYPFYCRITKKDLQIPAANEDKIISANMTNNEQILFEFLYNKYRGNILALYIRLMQASTNPQLLLRKLDVEDCNNVFLGEDDNLDEMYENQETFYKDIENEEVSDTQIAKLINNIEKTGKFNSGIETVKKLVSENKQVLVWGIFVKTLEDIKKELEKEEISCEVIDGKVAYKDREKIINKFKEGKIKVLIANPNTLAESVSLHKCCHDAVYFEYSFNLTHMVQSKDRINRLGLEKSQYTQYYYLMLKNTASDRYNSIDEKIYFRLKEKEKIMKNAIEGTEIKRIDFNDEDDLKIILNKQ